MIPTAVIESSQVVCREPWRYIGWPTVAHLGGGDLVAVFSGRRDQHICPFGVTELVRSTDGGRTWSDPVLINDTPLDDRDAGVLRTASGALVVSWFTSTYYADNTEHCRQLYGDEMVAGWAERIQQLTPQIRERWLGSWTRRSPDGGYTWEEPVRALGSAPHGPIQLADGRLLYVGVDYWSGPQRLTVEESRDEGRSWQLIATIAAAEGELLEHYHEPHVVETASGKLVALIRYEPGVHEQMYLRQSESLDGGRSWTVAHATPIWGYPPHLLRLPNGWLLASYGRRLPPFGEYACLSYDEGETWDVGHRLEIFPGQNGDLGYPATAALDDGSLYSVYYQIDQPGEKTCLMGTHWRLNA